MAGQPTTCTTGVSTPLLEKKSPQGRAAKYHQTDDAPRERELQLHNGAFYDRERMNCINAFFAKMGIYACATKIYNIQSKFVGGCKGDVFLAESERGRVVLKRTTGFGLNRLRAIGLLNASFVMTHESYTSMSAADQMRLKIPHDPERQARYFPARFAVMPHKGISLHDVMLSTNKSTNAYSITAMNLASHAFDGDVGALSSVSKSVVMTLGIIALSIQMVEAYQDMVAKVQQFDASPLNRQDRGGVLRDVTNAKDIIVSHGDLKPENVLLERFGRGIGRGETYRLTWVDPDMMRTWSNTRREYRSTSVSGTPGYLAPELTTNQFIVSKSPSGYGQTFEFVTSSGERRQVSARDIVDIVVPGKSTHSSVLSKESMESLSIEHYPRTQGGDIYALGAMIYELLMANPGTLTARPRFGSTWSRAELLSYHAIKRFPVPADRKSLHHRDSICVQLSRDDTLRSARPFLKDVAVRDGMFDLLSKMLEPDYTKRCQDWGDVLKGLKAAREDLNDVIRSALTPKPSPLPPRPVPIPAGQIPKLELPGSKASTVRESSSTTLADSPPRPTHKRGSDGSIIFPLGKTTLFRQYRGGEEKHDGENPVSVI